MNKQRAMAVCRDIALDMKHDASAFDGKPFDGRTVARYFGNQGAAIAALAHIIEGLLEPPPPTYRPDEICAACGVVRPCYVHDQPALECTS